MFGMLGVHEQRHLMRAEGSFDLEPIDEFWPRPPLGRAQDDHRPARPGRVAVLARTLLNLLDGVDGFVQCGGHEFMHLLRIVAFHE